MINYKGSLKKAVGIKVKEILKSYFLREIKENTIIQKQLSNNDYHQIRDLIGTQIGYQLAKASIDRYAKVVIKEIRVEQKMREENVDEFRAKQLISMEKVDELILKLRSKRLKK
jgi:hypothetical protein